MLPWGVTQPLGSPCEAGDRVGCLNSHRATMLPPATTASQKQEHGSHVAAEPGLIAVLVWTWICCRTAWNCLLPFISQCDLQLDVSTVLVSGKKLITHGVRSNYCCRAYGPRVGSWSHLVTASSEASRSLIKTELLFGLTQFSSLQGRSLANHQCVLCGSLNASRCL